MRFWYLKVVSQVKEVRFRPGRDPRRGRPVHQRGPRSSANGRPGTGGAGACARRRRYRLAGDHDPDAGHPGGAFYADHACRVRSWGLDRGLSAAQGVVRHEYAGRPEKALAGTRDLFPPGQDPQDGGTRRRGDDRPGRGSCPRVKATNLGLLGSVSYADELDKAPLSC